MPETDDSTSVPTPSPHLAGDHHEGHPSFGTSATWPADNIEPSQQEQHEQEYPATEEFVAGYTLRFAPQNVRIRVDPRKGYNYEGQSPEEPPLAVKEEAPSRFTRTKIGQTMDGTKPKRITDKRTGDVTEIHNDNEPVFLRTVARGLGYEYCDSLGRNLKDEMIRFDPGYETKEARAAEATNLGRLLMSWRNLQAEQRREEMKVWRSRVRRWEIWLLHREWFLKGNKIIFPPDCTNEKITAAIEALQKQQEDDVKRKIAVEFNGRPPTTTTIIRAPREECGSKRKRRASVSAEEGPEGAAGAAGPAGRGESVKGGRERGQGPRRGPGRPRGSGRGRGGGAAGS